MGITLDRLGFPSLAFCLVLTADCWLLTALCLLNRMQARKPQPRPLVAAQHHVQTLHSASRCALHQVVDRAERDYPAGSGVDRVQGAGEPDGAVAAAGACGVGKPPVQVGRCGSGWGTSPRTT